MTWYFTEQIPISPASAHQTSISPFVSNNQFLHNLIKNLRVLSFKQKDIKCLSNCTGMWTKESTRKYDKIHTRKFRTCPIALRGYCIDIVLICVTNDGTCRYSTSLLHFSCVCTHCDFCSCYMSLRHDVSLQPSCVSTITQWLSQGQVCFNSWWLVKILTVSWKIP